MLNFLPLKPEEKSQFDRFLLHCGQRGCEYNFANLFLWGRQKATFHEGNLAFFCQFNRKSVYLFPIGENLKPTLDAIISDSRKRGIPCRLTSLSERDQQLLETWYPGQFYFQPDRDSFDYVYAISDLAELKGKRLQRKRNHCNRFRLLHPHCTAAPITDENTPQVLSMLDAWYAQRKEADPTASFYLEQSAITKALKYRKELGMEGLVLLDKGQIIAMTLGSPLAEDTFDVHFEKAAQGYDGAYAAINREFAQYLQKKYPRLQWLNREDDMGLEGLRKAKLSYCPARLVEKRWACLKEDGYDC
ncbi:MAG: DUF2156 domain-containing protein [Oscillospiraceae bacterium]|nr:DUF2156 domain-containing protein [Oscillospiraceae bacterium]